MAYLTEFLIFQNAASKKQNKDGVRMNGNVRDSSPLSPNNKKDVSYDRSQVKLLQ